MDAATLTNQWSRTARYRSYPDTKIKVLRRKGQEIRVPCTRIINAPNPAMEQILDDFRNLLRAKAIPVPSATACPGSNTRRHLEPHRGNRYLVEIDISQAFRATGVSQLARLLTELMPELGTPRQIARFSERYLCEHGSLATGSPASPDLFNLVMEHYVLRWVRLVCEAEGITVTQYVDNLLFSSRRPITAAMRRHLRQVVSSSGFRINWDKCRVLDLAKQPAVICGLTIDLAGRIYVPRSNLRKLSGMMHSEDRQDSKLVGRVSGHAGVFRTNSGRTGALNRTEMRVWRQTRKRRNTTPAGRS